jgi:hypothetical protein
VVKVQPTWTSSSERSFATPKPSFQTLKIFNPFDAIEVHGKRIGRRAHRDPIVCIWFCQKVFLDPLQILACGVHSSHYSWFFMSG